MGDWSVFQFTCCHHVFPGFELMGKHLKRYVEKPQFLTLAGIARDYDANTELIIKHIIFSRTWKRDIDYVSKLNTCLTNNETFPVSEALQILETFRTCLDLDTNIDFKKT